MIEALVLSRLSIANKAKLDWCHQSEQPGKSCIFDVLKVKQKVCKIYCKTKISQNKMIIIEWQWRVYRVADCMNIHFSCTITRKKSHVSFRMWARTNCRLKSQKAAFCPISTTSLSFVHKQIRICTLFVFLFVFPLYFLYFASCVKHLSIYSGGMNYKSLHFYLKKFLPSAYTFQRLTDARMLTVYVPNAGKNTTTLTMAEKKNVKRK